MKKYILLAAAALVVFAGCSKIENAPEAQREISFAVAKHLQTKAGDNVVYDTNIPFGTYAWYTAGTTEGSQGVDFMTNETVGFVSPVWKTTVHTFYWPKTGSVDFISYSPFDGTNGTADSAPEVTKTTITYSGITAADVDYLYADKVTVDAATGVNTNNVNIDLNDDADRTAYSGAQYSGVPTLFRHALAKVAFRVKANFLEWGDGADKTTWKLTLMHFKVGGVYTKGDLHLSWDGSAWVPQDANKIWENPSDKTADQELANGLVLTTDFQDLAALTNPFVLPQKVDDQQVTIKLKIETTLANGNPLIEYYEKTFDLKDISSLEYIKMNQNIVYNISIKPTATSGSTDPSTFDNPEDVTITFDPAVADWETLSSSINIQL